MDLDDVLEDLLKGARRAVRDRKGPRREGRVTRRWLPTVAIVIGVWWMALLGLVAAGALALVDGGAGVAAALALAVVGLFGLPPAGWGVAEQRRRRLAQNDSRADRARAKAAAARAEALPPEVRDDWRRMEQARALVGDLAADGWVSTDAVAELDGHVAHLQKLLRADHRTRELGGRPSNHLARQVADLADLLVALADEAVDAQADAAAGARAPATVAQARDRMAALRAARYEVDEADGRGHPGAADADGRGQRGTTSTA